MMQNECRHPKFRFRFYKGANLRQITYLGKLNQYILEDNKQTCQS